MSKKRSKLSEISDLLNEGKNQVRKADLELLDESDLPLAIVRVESAIATLELALKEMRGDSTPSTTST